MSFRRDLHRAPIHFNDNHRVVSVTMTKLVLQRFGEIPEECVKEIVAVIEGDVWLSRYNSIFSPKLFTGIEEAKGIEYTARLLSEGIGKVCIVEVAVMPARPEDLFLALP